MIFYLQVFAGLSNPQLRMCENHGTKRGGDLRTGDWRCGVVTWRLQRLTRKDWKGEVV